MTESIPRQVVRVPLKDLLAKAAKDQGIQHNGLIPAKSEQERRELKQRTQRRIYRAWRAGRDVEIRAAILKSLEEKPRSAINILDLSEEISKSPDLYPELAKSSLISIKRIVSNFCNREGFVKPGKDSPVWFVPEGWQ